MLRLPTNRSNPRPLAPRAIHSVPSSTGSRATKKKGKMEKKREKRKTKSRWSAQQ